jgi:ribonuclease R
MGKLFDGDEVLVRVSGVDRRGRKEAAVVEVLNRRYREIVGRYYYENGYGFLVPESKRINHEILIPNKPTRGAGNGEFVVAEIISYPEKNRKAVGRISEILGDRVAPGVEVEIALRSHEIPSEFSADAIRQAKILGKEIKEDDLEGRYDLRDLPFITIDGEDAKDFDDAVFVRDRDGGGWSLFVAIADVAHYVCPDSPLDNDAVSRGSSVYFPGHVVPMLPEKLSNGLCSLKPDVDRLVLVCEISIAESGESLSSVFYEAVIHSHGRLTYDEVATILNAPESNVREKQRLKVLGKYSELVSHIERLGSLFHVLHGFRQNNGAMDFDTVETRIVFGENRKIREIVPVERNNAHRLVEECMLRANVAAAELLTESKLPALFRVHEGPNPEKLENLRLFLKEMGVVLGGGEKPNPKDYQLVLKKIVGRADYNLIQTMLIRSMMQAVYQPENVGHFGLGYEAYTHFTSPIRRYPDLLVHRAIRYLVRHSKNENVRKKAGASKIPLRDIYPYDHKAMIELGESCSSFERRADAAAYGVIDWLKCEYMQNKIGDEFFGTVVSVTSFGLFVELNEIFVEGLIHISELGNDYYLFDQIHHALKGERSGKIYRLGDVIEVTVVRVDLDDLKIDLQLSGADAAQEAPTKRQKKKGSSAKKKERELKSYKKTSKKPSKTKKKKATPKR